MSIVLGYDESPGARAALAVAIELAQQYATTLVIAYATGPPGGLGEEFRSHEEALEELGRDVLDHAIHTAREAAVDAQVLLVPERPAQALLTAAAQHHARFIVVGTWGESPLRSAMIGSTPHRLLEHATCPVVCVPAGSR